ncbi:unnamed protein product, partial [Didymodactylos carnosus]
MYIAVRDRVRSFMT